LKQPLFAGNADDERRLWLRTCSRWRGDSFCLSLGHAPPRWRGRAVREVVGDSAYPEVDPGGKHPLPPGDAPWGKKPSRSEWEDFSFALHEVQQLIEPSLPLLEAMRRWPQIAPSLAERPRRRVPQLERVLLLSQRFWSNAPGYPIDSLRQSNLGAIGVKMSHYPRVDSLWDFSSRGGGIIWPYQWILA
jgi:hypothetical protein